MKKTKQTKKKQKNSQLGHGQPLEQTRGLFCMCDFGVARCQSQRLYHFWRLGSMFEAYCTGAVNQIRVIHEAMNGCKNLKIH